MRFCWYSKFNDCSQNDEMIIQRHAKFIFPCPQNKLVLSFLFYPVAKRLYAGCLIVIICAETSPGKFLNWRIRAEERQNNL